MEYKMTTSYKTMNLTESLSFIGRYVNYMVNGKYFGSYKLMAVYDDGTVSLLDKLAEDWFIVSLSEISAQ